jgi:hypothetical protein
MRSGCKAFQLVGRGLQRPKTEQSWGVERGQDQGSGGKWEIWGEQNPCAIVGLGMGVSILGECGRVVQQHQESF